MTAALKAGNLDAFSPALSPSASTVAVRPQFSTPPPRVPSASPGHPLLAELTY